MKSQINNERSSEIRSLVNDEFDEVSGGIWLLPIIIRIPPPPPPKPAQATVLNVIRSRRY